MQITPAYLKDAGFWTESYVLKKSWMISCMSLGTDRIYEEVSDVAYFQTHIGGVDIVCIYLLGVNLLL